jgi:uncharacterized membrane-anchored protein
MKETTKTIRNKMYSWVMAKGIYLEHKDHEEIKNIMEEYRNFKIPILSEKTNVQSTVMSVAKPEKKDEKKSEWKPYPVD